MRSQYMRIAPAEVRGQPETKPSVFSLVVPYTTLELTKAALRHAAVCSDLDVHVHLVDVNVVPFPCPLDQPPIDKEYSIRRLRQLFDESDLKGHAQILYTRDRVEAFRQILEPDSLVILATKKRWWPTDEKRLAAALKKQGHQVMLVPMN